MSRLFLLVALSASVVCCSDDNTSPYNPEEDSYVYWCDTCLLKRTDFRMTVPDTAQYAAYTRSGISYRCSFDQNDYIATINAFFVRDSSYFTSGAKDNILLDHEQGHFDISEITARAGREKISRWDGGTVFEEFVKKCIDSIVVPFEELQNLYDSETKHGTDLKMQKMWQSKIDSWLKEGEKFRESSVYVDFNAGQKELSRYYSVIDSIDTGK
jgi:hypothetical protein